jgi:hypothetical protein
MAQIINEPNMSQIDDFNNNESKEKRRIINLVIFSGLAIGIVYTIAFNMFNQVEDQIPMHDISFIQGK